MSIIPEDPFGPIKEAKQKTTPPPDEVNRLHDKSDVDSSQMAQHHTLGLKHDQASPGDHTHNGQNSKLLMENVTISGSRGGNAALASLITALSDALGFTDGTTP